jgi:hypothetical protein
VIASVLVLQTIHNLSDRETSDAVTFDSRWKAALLTPTEIGPLLPYFQLPLLCLFSICVKSHSKFGKPQNWERKCEFLREAVLGRFPE